MPVRQFVDHNRLDGTDVASLFLEVGLDLGQQPTQTTRTLGDDVSVREDVEDDSETEGEEEDAAVEWSSLTLRSSWAVALQTALVSTSRWPGKRSRPLAAPSIQ